MAIDFPDSPSVNDTHAYIGRTWKYDGTDTIITFTAGSDTITWS